MNKFDKKLIGKEEIKKSRNLNDIFFKSTDPNNIDDKTIINLPIEELYAFENHPFRVTDDDDKMFETIESIKKQGVIYPIIVRQLDNKEGFQIISGHRRTRACELLGIKHIPSIVKKIDDEESIILMVDSNIQREELLFSEKAFAYKMRLEALKRKAGRPKNNCSQVGNNYDNSKSSEIMALQIGASKNQIFRYIRLTHLIPELLYMTDKKKLPFTVSVELSYLNNNEQLLVLNKIKDFRNPTLIEAKKLKDYSTDTDEGVTIEIINNLFEVDNINNLELKNKPLKNMLIKNDVLKKYFKEDIEEKEIESIILNLLELHYKNK